MDHVGQTVLPGHRRCRESYLASSPSFRPILFPSSISSYSHHLPLPTAPYIPRALVPLPPPIPAWYPSVRSASFSPGLSIDVYRSNFSRSSQRRNGSMCPYASLPPPTIGSWNDRLLYGNGRADGAQTHSESHGNSEVSIRSNDDPLETFLTYLNDAFPDVSDFDQPSKCSLSIKEEPSATQSIKPPPTLLIKNEPVSPESSNASSSLLIKEEPGLNDTSSSQGKLEWDDDYVAFNESLALKDQYRLNPAQAEDQRPDTTEQVDRTIPRKLKQAWIKSSQLEAERESQSSGRPLRLEWPSPSSNRASYSWGPYFVLAPFWIDVNRRVPVPDLQTSGDDSPIEAEEDTLSQDTGFRTDETVINAKSPKVLIKDVEKLPIQDSDHCTNRKKRKQVHPRKSPPLVDPTFKGVVVSFETVLQKRSSRLLVHHKYSNIPRQAIKCRTRKRRRDTYSSSDSYSDMEDSFLDQEDWISCPGKKCTSCGAKKTPLWRDAEDGTPLCNACGIRYRKYRMRCSECWYIPRKDGKSEARCGCCGANLRKSSVLRY